MPFVAPTVIGFIARYPRFKDLEPAYIAMALDDALVEVTGDWFEEDRPKAMMLLAAHRLQLLQAELQQADGGGIQSVVQVDAPIKAVTVGPARIEYATGAEVSSGSGSAKADLGSTDFGSQYLELMRLNFPGVGVV